MIVERLAGWLTDSRSRLLTSIGLLALRVGAGGLMLTHGWGKLSNFSTYQEKFPDPIGVGPTLGLTLAVFAEFFCSIAVALGLATRLAVVPLLVTMLVAAAIVHADDPWQKKELAVLYMVPFLTLAFTGAGAFSLDAVLWRRLTKDQG